MAVDMESKHTIKRKRKIKPCTDADKEAMKLKAKAENTHKATKLWTNCFQNYLTRNGLPDIDTISNNELPSVLENYFIEIRKVKKTAEDSESIVCPLKIFNLYLNRLNPN